MLKVVGMGVWLWCSGRSDFIRFKLTGFNFSDFSVHALPIKASRKSEIKGIQADIARSWLVQAPVSGRHRRRTHHCLPGPSGFGISRRKQTGALIIGVRLANLGIFC